MTCQIGDCTEPATEQIEVTVRVWGDDEFASCLDVCAGHYADVDPDGEFHQVFASDRAVA